MRAKRVGGGLEVKRDEVPGSAAGLVAKPGGWGSSPCGGGRANRTAPWGRVRGREWARGKRRARFGRRGRARPGLLALARGQQGAAGRRIPAARRRLLRG